MPALLIVSLIAGIISVLAPCTVSMLPILLARSADGKRTRSPLLIIGGLLGSIFIFSIILKASTALIGVPKEVWQIISGGIIIIFGVFTLSPDLWEKITGASGLQLLAQKKSASALQKKGKLADVLLGASLGPVFSACSPTYALIVASILPAKPVEGVLYLVVFLIGLGSMLTLITLAGSAAIKKLGWGINPHGWFKRVLGILFIILGIMLATGFDKTIQTDLINRGWFDWQVTLESKLQ